MSAAVGGGDDDDAVVCAKAVHFDQQLVQRLLALVVSAAETCAALTAHRVDLIDKDDGRAQSFWPVSNRSRTREAPTPTYISTKSEPEIEKNGTPASPATARASSVLPVPGGPTSSTPLAECVAPSELNFFGILQEIRRPRCSSSFSSSAPATSAKVALRWFVLLILDLGAGPHS